MTAFLIEIAGLFAFAVHTRLAWFRRAAWSAPEPQKNWRNWADFGGLLGGLGLAAYAKFVMPVWAALALAAFFLAMVWVGIHERNRDSFPPPALLSPPTPPRCPLTPPHRPRSDPHTH